MFRILSVVATVGMAALAALAVAPGVQAAGVDLSRLAPLPDVKTVVPKDNPMTPAKVELGKMLYFDPRLAGDSSKSCASCHVPDAGWAHGDQLSPAYPGTKHWRTVPTVVNAAYAKLFFWDGRAGSLEEQAQGPIQAPIEMNQNPDHLVEKLSGIPWYQKKFKEAFDDEVTFDNIARAIASFERTVTSKNVPFDAYLKGDKDALDDEQIRGLELFVGKAMCIECHHGPLLTDDKLHATGVPEIEPLHEESDRVATRHFFVKGTEYRHPKMAHRVDADYGREFITLDAKDKFRFKTPTLREIFETAPYMHNGAFITLEEVIDFYDKGGGDLPNKDPLMKPLHLTDDEKAALLAFLESLSGDPISMEVPELPKKADGTF